MSDKSRECGFTLPELLVTGAVLLIVIVLSYVFVHPRDYAPHDRNAGRWLGVATLAQALNKYEADHNALPAGLTDRPKIIGNTTEEELDWCAALVPKYIPDVPLDPVSGYQLAVDTCVSTEADPTAYSTGFTVKREKNGSVTIAAPQAEGARDIHITRNYQL